MRILKDGAMPSMLPGLPPFAPVSMRLLEILSREDAVVEQVAELLRLDAVFVGEIMRLADTPVFGFQRKIRSLAHVVALLGTRRLCALVATVALRQSSGAHRELHGYWRHSVAAGFLAAEMAASRGMDPEQPYTGALLYDATAPGTLDQLQATPPNSLAEGAPVQSLTEAVGLAGRISEELGFSLVACPPQNGLDEILSAIPEPARRSFAADPARLARLLEEKIRIINN